MTRSRQAARRLVLRRLLDERRVSSQEELVKLLAARGHRVTQTTVSRDLAALGVGKHTGTSGTLYRGGQRPAPANDNGQLAHMLREFVLQIHQAQNLVLLKTPPGAAHPVASALDHDTPDGVLGTVAGDDTVLVITRDTRGGTSVARRLEALLES